MSDGLGKRERQSLFEEECCSECERGHPVTWAGNIILPVGKGRADEGGP